MWLRLHVSRIENNDSGHLIMARDGAVEEILFLAGIGIVDELPNKTATPYHNAYYYNSSF